MQINNDIRCSAMLVCRELATLRENNELTLITPNWKHVYRTALHQAMATLPQAAFAMDPSTRYAVGQVDQENQGSLFKPYGYSMIKWLFFPPAALHSDFAFRPLGPT